MIGNIVTNEQIHIDKNFNIVNSEEDCISELPTLILGWKYVNSKYPNYDIINRKISENLFWSFSRSENRGQQEEDIYNFVNYCYNRLISNIKYYFFDVFQINIKTLRKILNKINNTSNIISYLHNSMIYMYFDNIILGINLDFIDYYGYSLDRLVGKIEKKSSVFLKKDEIFIEYKREIENLDNQVKYIPYLYSIEHG